MNTLSFLNSPLLWGLSLAAIPILIHLLYRRQYRRIEWAPMRYLKLTVQRNRRRIRIEQIILLLLRTAAVLLLFFLVARPVMNAEGFSRWLGTGGRVNRIVVLDDSLSMGYTDAGKSSFARAQETISGLASTFNPKDRFTLLAASAPEAPLLREVELEDNAQIEQVIRQTPPRDVFVAWEPVLAAIDKLIAGGSYPLVEVTMVTDLRRSGWESLPADLASRWATEHVRLRIFDVGFAETRNVSLVGLEQTDRLALAGGPTRFEAQLRNDSGEEQVNLEANFIVDGKASLVRVPNLTAGETLRLPLVATFQDAGPHQLAFELPTDALTGDNSRWISVDVQPSVDVRLIDGEPASEPLAGETDFLALALSIPTEGNETFRVDTMTDSEWASSRAAEPDLLVIANLAHISASQVESLERQVEAGMGLMIFLGDAVDPDSFNQWLYKNGAGLSPAALEAVVDGEFSGVLVEPSPESPLASLTQLSAAALERIKVRKIFEAQLPAAAEGSHVLARWNNQESAPAVIQKVFGRGYVLLWTLTADRAWSDWPTESSYVLAVREAARAIARSSASLHAFTTGQTLKVALAITHDITQPTLQLPGENEAKAIVISQTPSAADGSIGKQLLVADTRRAGIYSLAWQDSVTGGMKEAFAVNPDPRESELGRMTPPDMTRLFEPMTIEVVSLSSADDSTRPLGGEEIWRVLATGLLGLLIFESCFARWAGRSR